MNVIEDALALTSVVRSGDTLDAFWRMCEQRDVGTVFQPIIRMTSGEIIGYEGLTRPPAGSPYANAIELFAAASRFGLRTRFELLCAERCVERFERLGLRGKLLINLSPETIVQAHLNGRQDLEFLRRSKLTSGRVIVELTEQKTSQFEQLREALAAFRALGIEVAIDDLGQGFSSLWLWSELHPELVKVDRHFVTGIHADPIKFQFLKALQQIADSCGSRLVAEGIEDQAELLVLRDMGIEYGQGYLIGRPQSPPIQALEPQLFAALRGRGIAVFPEMLRLPGSRVASGERLMMKVAPVSPQTTCDEVLERFELTAEPHALPVVEGDKPVGLINRNDFVSQYVRRYRKELFGKRSCAAFMNAEPLLIDRKLSIHEISDVLTRAEARHLADGFIITDEGRYLGIAAGQDLIREITAMQLEAARYANPLTMLPGNVPIDEHIERLLSARVGFVAAYCDLNHFKAFNDAYGYRRGDQMIKLAARALAAVCDARRDFIGHIGGDDFIVLFQSDDWEARCRRALDNLAREAEFLFDEADTARGTLLGTDRQGRTVSIPLTSLAIGAVPVDPGTYGSHMHVSSAANEAKKRAKALGGNTVFVERRRPA